MGKFNAKINFLELLQANWMIMNAIFLKLGHSAEQQEKVNRDQRKILIINS